MALHSTLPFNPALARSLVLFSNQYELTSTPGFADLFLKILEPHVLSGEVALDIPSSMETETPEPFFQRILRRRPFLSPLWVSFIEKHCLKMLHHSDDSFPSLFSLFAHTNGGSDLFWNTVAAFAEKMPLKALHDASHQPLFQLLLSKPPVKADKKPVTLQLKEQAIQIFLNRGFSYKLKSGDDDAQYSLMLYNKSVEGWNSYLQQRGDPFLTSDDKKRPLWEAIYLANLNTDLALDIQAWAEQYSDETRVRFKKIQDHLYVEGFSKNSMVSKVRSHILLHWDEVNAIRNDRGENPFFVMARSHPRLLNPFLSPPKYKSLLSHTDRYGQNILPYLLSSHGDDIKEPLLKIAPAKKTKRGWVFSSRFFYYSGALQTPEGLWFGLVQKKWPALKVC